MSRPTYETKEHKIKQRQVADVIEKSWKVVCKDMSYRDVIDYAMCREDNIVGWIEVK